MGLSASSPTATTSSGFLRDARGRITAINRPGAVITIAFDINNRGQITGEYIRVGSDGIGDSESGFVRDKRGRLTVFDVPGAKGTEAIKVNDRGQIVGIAPNPEDLPSPPSTDTAPMGRMA